MKTTLALSPPPELDVPRRRYWGDRQPPKNRADMFSVRVASAAADTSTSTGDPAPASTGSVATLRIYGPIDSWGGWFGVSAKDVSSALDQLPADVSEVRVRINSPGGEVWEGMAILNMLRAHRARITAVVDGLAASAASVIAAGCDETIMSPGTQMMIHDASAFAFGPAATMDKASRFLSSVSDSIASIYSEAAGGTDAEWRALMVAETWYTAKEAVEAGLAGSVAVVPDAGEASTAGDDTPVEEMGPDEGEVEDRFDLSIYNYAGRSQAPAPMPPTASAAGSTTTQGTESAVAFSDEQMKTMRQELGLPEAADEAHIVAALAEALAERADAPAAPAETKIPEGHIVVPAALIEDLKAGASLAVSTAKKLNDEEREKFLTANRTKFAPANRAAWAKEFDRDPEGTRKHFETAPVIVPLAALGHEGDVEEPQDAATAIDDTEIGAFASGLGLTKEDLRV